MSDFLSLFLVSLAGLFALPVFLFCVEVVAAVAVPRSDAFPPPKNDVRPRIAVLVPAHNESAGLLDTLGDIKAQLHSNDRLVVVADNCTDDTAVIAKLGGAEVVERHDLGKIGKGYALDCGLQHVSVDPPDVVMVIDADCRLTSDAIHRMAAACASTCRPVQVLNLMTAPEASSIDYRVAMFAFRVKNWVRPLGLRALNLPCQLMGTGMAFPWELIRSANLASGQQVEDLKLGLDLARAGHPPLFFLPAAVTSQFPSTVTGARSQRQRWEQGHIGIITKILPRLLYESLTRKNFSLLVLACDAAVPPLTLLGALAFLMLAVSVVGALFGLSSSAMVISAASLSVFLLAVLLCWLNFGRDILPVGSIMSVAAYVANKLPLYNQIIFRAHRSQWIRTDRAKREVDSESA